MRARLQVFSSISKMELAYGPDSLQKAKVYLHDPSNTRTLVFIHGGAWRDPGNTFNDFEDFALYLDATSGVRLNIFGLNYRLSPAIKHPCHLEDVVAGLNYLCSEFGITHTHLVGHSVGATLILQMIQIARGKLAAPIRVHNCYLIDGIYDIPELLQEYPDYRSFVLEAFELQSAYTDATAIYDRPMPKCTSLFILQSRQDELLSSRQTETLIHHLQDADICGSYTLQWGDWGKHEEVYKNRDLFRVVGNTLC